MITWVVVWGLGVFLAGFGAWGSFWRGSGGASGEMWGLRAPLARFGAQCRLPVAQAASIAAKLLSALVALFCGFLSRIIR